MDDSDNEMSWVWRSLASSRRRNAMINTRKMSMLGGNVCGDSSKSVSKVCMQYAKRVQSNDAMLV